ncbi:unnamed protein product [Aureobasidium uvarum]|uniref:Copper transport protein n=1 Tax=Aureobasidium uvarum TaxID=2773716 RepID=A0A9N8PTN9_9PEZI|nr:unnamed protein product [Aureobasidium uvarum]
MDHGNMGHGGMDHGGMDHGNMCNMNVSLYQPPQSTREEKTSKLTHDTPEQMLFTWNTENLCIVFKSWRVTSTFSLLWSLLAIIVLTAGYELIREVSRKYESKVQREIDDSPSKFLSLFLPLMSLVVCVFFAFALVFAEMSWGLKHLCKQKDDQEQSSLLASSGQSAADKQAKSKTIKAALYAVQVFYSFFIM